tara:strand:- start:1261 stop:2112 length:852 start_codon:yes stop_codon:yes gene_type:complete
LLSAIWGSSFIFIKISVESIHPTLLTLYRLLIASVFLFFFCEITKIKKLFNENKIDLLVIAFVGNVIPFNLISWSEIYVDSVIASTLIGTMPLFTFLISFFLLNNSRSSFRTSIGLFTGFSGMIIFLGPNSLVEIENSIYLFLIVLASIMYAFSANWVNKLNENSSIELAFCSISLAAIVSFPIFFITISILDLQILNLVNSIGFFSFISASILGIICTGFAISLFFYLIKKKSAIFASQSNYLIPCFGFLWSFIFLTEKLSFNLLAGLILIVLGGYLVDKKN